MTAVIILCLLFILYNMLNRCTHYPSLPLSINYFSKYLNKNKRLKQLKMYNIKNVDSHLKK